MPTPEVAVNETLQHFGAAILAETYGRVARVPMLAHYTSVGNFKSILRSKELWFSRIRDTNDTSEAIEGASIVAAALAEHGPKIFKRYAEFNAGAQFEARRPLLETDTYAALPLHNSNFELSAEIAGPRTSITVLSPAGSKNGGKAMIIGMSLHAFTVLHVVITLIAIATGFVVMFGMVGSHRLPAWTAIFWLTTLLTSVTGFMFPIHGFTPALGVGGFAMIVLAIGLVALYVKHLAGSWRWIYTVTAVISLYLNFFVLITQSFQKLSFINPLAPQVGPPFTGATNTQFAIAQAVALLFFIVMGIVTSIKFRPGTASA